MLIIINMYYIQMYNIYMENFLQPNLILMFFLGTLYRVPSTILYPSSSGIFTVVPMVLRQH